MLTEERKTDAPHDEGSGDLPLPLPIPGEQKLEAEDAASQSSVRSARSQRSSSQATAKKSAAKKASSDEVSGAETSGASASSSAQAAAASASDPPESLFAGLVFSVLPGMDCDRIKQAILVGLRPSLLTPLARSRIVFLPIVGGLLSFFVGGLLVCVCMCV